MLIRILLTPVFALLSTLEQRTINSETNFSSTSNNAPSVASIIPNPAFTNPNVMSSAITMVPRRWFQRGQADHGWLKTAHTFSFASYYDPKYMNFGALRVINEDRVAPSEGFPKHPHANAEIFSYVVGGQLGHTDSMGNKETIDSTKIQFTSAGTGISHSEYNGSKDKEVHFLQIWYTPETKNLPPKYYTSMTPVEFKQDKLHTLIKPHTTFTSEELKVTGDLPEGRAIPAHAPLVTRASILSPQQKVSHILGEEANEKEGAERWLYAHLAQTSGYKDPDFSDMGIKGEASIQITSPSTEKQVTLKEGDGVFIKGGRKGDRIDFENVGPKGAEL